MVSSHAGCARESARVRQQRGWESGWTTKTRPRQSSGGGCCRGSAGGSADGKRARSSSGEQRCACRASSGGESGEDRLPVVLLARAMHRRLSNNSTDLVLAPGSAATRRGRLPLLLHGIVVTVHNITGRGVDARVVDAVFHRWRHVVWWWWWWCVCVCKWTVVTRSVTLNEGR